MYFSAIVLNMLIKIQREEELFYMLMSYLQILYDLLINIQLSLLLFFEVRIGIWQSIGSYPFDSSTNVDPVISFVPSLLPSRVMIDTWVSLFSGCQDEKFLIWCSRKEERQLKLSSVTKIIPGQWTVCNSDWRQSLTCFIQLLTSLIV